MHAVDGNVVFHKITVDRLGQPLGVLDAHRPASGRVRFHFNHVALMAIHAGDKLIELPLGVLGKQLR